MSELDLTAAVEAVLVQEWCEEFRWSAHSHHNYSSECKVCRGDVRSVLETALPYVEAAVRVKVAEEIRAHQRASGLPFGEAFCALNDAAKVAVGSKVTT